MCARVLIRKVKRKWPPHTARAPHADGEQAGSRTWRQVSPYRGGCHHCWKEEEGGDDFRREFPAAQLSCRCPKRNSAVSYIRLYWPIVLLKGKKEKEIYIYINSENKKDRKREEREGEEREEGKKGERREKDHEETDQPFLHQTENLQDDCAKVLLEAHKVFMAFLWSE